ncbi:MAG: PorP/SprF family type IX secretion system membrane protein [Chitinophagaceae bacterium]
MNKKLVIILFAVLVTLHSLAQDPGFSQFYASPLTLNPALTGKFDGLYRIAGNYRDQWPAISKAYVTSTISADLAILPNRISETDTWGVGVMAMTDRTANGILTSNYISISTAYHKGLDENGLHQIGVGFQGSFAGKKLDGGKLNFEEELDQFGGWTNPTSEPINGRSVSVNYFDFNAGMLYNGSTNGYNNYYFGASFYHINKPKESFDGGYYLLNPRLTLHGGGYLTVAENAILHLSAVHSRQAGATNTVLGGAVALNVNGDLDNPTSFYAGSWYRFGDAIIPYLGLEFADFRLGATYDVNVSSLKTASQSRGGIEISLIYIKRHNGERKNIPCPKF